MVLLWAPLWLGVWLGSRCVGGEPVTDIDALKEIKKGVDAAAREYHDYLANAPEPFRDSPQLRRERDWLEGFFQQRLFDAFPAMASELEAARKVCEALRNFDAPLEKLAAYDRVMEEQR